MSWLGDGPSAQWAVVWAEQGDVSQEERRVEAWYGNLSVQRAATASHIAPDITVFTAVLPEGDAETARYQILATDHEPTEVAMRPVGDSWRFIAYGDHGVGEESDNSFALVPMVAAAAPHAILHVGDLSYANARPAVWDEWFHLIEPVASRAFYMAAPGNHEHEGYYPVTSPGEDQVANAHDVEAVLDPYRQFRERFHFGADDLRYSFDLGPVHVTVINTEQLCAWEPAQYYVPWRVNPRCDTPSTTAGGYGVDDERATVVPNQELIDWVAADLAANQAPWNFVIMHQPTYSAGSYEGRAVLQEHFVPLFEEHGVDLVLAGHDHNYQRSYPLRDHAPVNRDMNAYGVDDGPIYIVTGGAGEGRYGLEDDAPWRAVGNSTFHYLRLDVTWDAIEGTAVEVPTGEVLDVFTIGARSLAPEPPAVEQSPGLPLLAVLGVLAVAVRRRLGA